MYAASKLLISAFISLPMSLVGQTRADSKLSPDATNAPPPSATPSAGVVTRIPRVFLQSASKGTNRNSGRDQSSEMAKDFEKDCPDIRVTINQAKADYTVSLNHIEVGAFIRDNQFEIYDADGDRMKGKEGGSIRNGVKGVCAVITTDFATKITSSATR